MKALLFDCLWYDAYPYDTDLPPEYPGDVVKTGGAGEMKRACINRHVGPVNYLYMDWSVRETGLKKLWALNWYRGFNMANAWTKAGGVMPEDWPQWMRTFRDY